MVRHMTGSANLYPLLRTYAILLDTDTIIRYSPSTFSGHAFYVNTELFLFIRRLIYICKNILYELLSLLTVFFNAVPF